MMGDYLLPRRQYQDGVELSILGFGGIIVVGMEQPDANNMVAEAIAHGVNYFDVAPTYANGEAERKQGIALKPYRKDIFLACKTEQRDAVNAQAALEESLRRAHTDYFDLYQFHALTTLDEVDQVLAPGGAAEVFFKARQEGKVRFLGASCHSVEAAISLMDRFPMDSVLFPLNYVCYAQGHFGPQVVQRAKVKGVARLALKAMAHRPWGKDEEHTYPKAWYKPQDDPELGSKALRFTLSEDITAALSPGDEKSFRFALNVAEHFTLMAADERAALLATTADTEPLFQLA
jgi:predicted aldo/keto reductase-like oxidoreductase